MTWCKCPVCKKGCNPNGGWMFSGPMRRTYHVKCFMKFSQTPECKKRYEQYLKDMRSDKIPSVTITLKKVKRPRRKEMSDKEIVKYHDKAFALLSDEILEKCATRLRRVVKKKTKEAIKKDFAKHGPYWWCIRTGHHFGWGMWVRNCLRRVVTDDKLPKNKTVMRNWDNYYVQVVEYALGLRKRE